MTDVLTPKQRAHNMSQIRSGNTKPELRLAELLTANGFGDFQLHPKDLSGKPDFYFHYRRAVVFVDGCFWHGCKRCYAAPKTNKRFWDEKIKKNKERDNLINKELKGRGLRVIRIAEHEFKNSELVLEKIVKNLPKSSAPKVLDLFAGAGGLSEGFIRAGCNMIGHVEMDADSCETIITRMIYHALCKRGKYEEYKNYVLGYVTRDELIEKYGLQKEKNSVICVKIGKNNYKEIIGGVRDRLDGEALDIIVGGPPCQAYSYIGRARDNNNMKRDERNFLFRYYVEFLKALNPKIFVFENVPGIESAGKGRYLREMRCLMKKAGYETDYKILNAADFGVPQNRKRVILVGWNKNAKLKNYPEFSKKERSYKVRDFFTDLPKIKAGEGFELGERISKNKFLEQVGILDPEFNLIMSHSARPNNAQDLEIYKMAVMAKEKGENIKYNQLPERLKTHNNENGFLDRFKVVDLNNRGSHTVVAHIAKDGHFYIHPDLKQNRSITVREASRLQTFPDDFKFEGSRTSQYKQIGNAVPPMLSEVIAKELVKYI